jgi:hypothetical protein
MNPSEFVTIDEAMTRSGLDRRTLQNRVKGAGVDIYQDGHDRRRHLLRAADLPRLTEMRPAVPQSRRKTSGVVPRRTAVLSDAADAWSAVEHPEADA